MIIILIFSFPIYSQQVNPDGSFSYTYPLNIPPGVNGMRPNIALTYNSNSGNGFLGMGWSLSGLSVITRDSSYEIGFDGDDHYLLDGQRLIPDDTETGRYHTEHESFLRIKAYDLNTSTSYWVVTQKNGTKMYFGYDAASPETDGHIDAVEKGGKALLWALNRVEDVHGNYYTVEYAEDTVNGDYYQAKITWTKGNGLTVYNTVEFYYETRNDSCNRYVPSLMKIDRRLRWIIVKVDTSIERKYKLEYEETGSTVRSKLLWIQEYGQGGNEPDSIWVAHSWEDETVEKRPEMKFDWEKGQQEWDTGNMFTHIPE
jgi:hypothetical protein